MLLNSSVRPNKISEVLALFMTLASSLSALAQPQQVFPLWSGAAPSALGVDPLKDVPTLSPFWPTPEKATGAAMIICPGGGYGHLAPHEGKDFALWLSQQGIASFVLKYRLGSSGYRHPVMLNDLQRAIRTLRFNAGAWKIDARKIGVMGSSAGGHLAATAMTHFDSGQKDAPDPIDRVSSRPDLGVLCYPVITMGPLTNKGSRDNLLGPNPAPDLVKLLSNELQVTRETPPCFLWQSSTDGAAQAEASLQWMIALRRNQVPLEVHIYQGGAHGVGLGVKGYDPAKNDAPQLLPWTFALTSWLKTQEFLPAVSTSPAIS